MRNFIVLFCYFLCLINLFPKNLFAYDESEIIDITGLNFGTLKLAINVEITPQPDSIAEKRIKDLFKKNLLWSGLFDFGDSFDNIDLLLKIEYQPQKGIKAWIVTQDNNLLYNGSKLFQKDKNYNEAIKSLVKEIILQLTGKKSILGSAIVYAKRIKNQTYQIVLTNLFNSRSTVLIDDGQINILPRWSPNGSSFLYTSLDNSGSKLFQYFTGTRKIVPILANFNKISGGTWLSNSNEIVITLAKKGNSDLYRMNLSGTRSSRLTRRTSSESNPKLSPDSSRLLFVSNRAGSIQIYQQILNTGETFRMTFKGNYNVEPSWSSNGEHIVFAGIIDGRFQLFLMDKEGEFVHQLTQGKMSAEQPVWSPNGRQILYVSKINYDQKLFVIRADGTYKRRLTKSPKGVSEFNPSWTTNYKWISETK